MEADFNESAVNELTSWSRMLNTVAWGEWQREADAGPLAPETAHIAQSATSKGDSDGLFYLFIYFHEKGTPHPPSNS